MKRTGRDGQETKGMGREGGVKGMESFSCHVISLHFMSFHVVPFHLFIHPFIHYFFTRHSSIIHSHIPVFLRSFICSYVDSSIHEFID